MIFVLSSKLRKITIFKWRVQQLSYQLWSFESVHKINCDLSSWYLNWKIITYEIYSLVSRCFRKQYLNRCKYFLVFILTPITARSNKFPIFLKYSSLWILISILLSMRNIIVHLVVWLKSIDHNIAIYIVL